MHLLGGISIRGASGSLAAILILNLLSGCATIMRGDPQTVRVTTNPPGRTLYYQGRRVSDGEHLTVTKQFRTPQFNVGHSDSPVVADLGYSVEPWVLGDAGLALLFLLPGLIAGGVDIGTGAWRKLDDPQIVVIPDPAAASAPPTATAAPPSSPPSTPEPSPPAPKPRSKPSTAAKTVAPAAPAAPLSVEEGIVSWYEATVAGQATASGESFDPERMAAAHRTLPFGALVRVTRLDTRQSVEVVINDRGPRVDGRILDLTRKPASQLGLLDVGLAPCRVEVLRLPGR